MINFIVRKLTAVVTVVFIVSILVFLMVHLIPGDPAVALAGENATPEHVEPTRERLGLGGPLPLQYWNWVTSAVRGDLGSSLFTGQAVTTSIMQRLPATLSLTFGALVVAIIAGFPGGILAGSRQGTVTDRAMTTLTSFGIAVPNYFLGLMLVLIFAINVRWLPATGYVPFGEDPAAWFRHLILPCVTLGVGTAAVLARQLRSSLAFVLQTDYIRMGRAKGMRRSIIVNKLALKNAVIPIVTVLGAQLAFLLGGTVLIERVFAIPGLGQLAVTAVTARDVPVIQGIVVFTALMVIIINLLVDISYGYLNPKMRRS